MTEPAAVRPAPVPVGAPRLRALDGLRGIAAVVVVLHHSALLDQGVSDVYLDPAKPITPFAALITRTPLQLLFSGQEAVLVFFVLSGLVVALPALGDRPFSWIAYYPRRMVRLLLPVWAAIIVSLIFVLTALRDPSTAVSTWAAGSTFPHPGWKAAAGDFDLLFGDLAIDNPLWSLRYELLFSLLLPLYVVLVRVVGRRVWIPVLGALVLIAGGLFLGNPNWFYLPVFLLGTVMAAHLEALRGWLQRRTTGARTLLGLAALVVALGALDARWLLRDVPLGPVALLPNALFLPSAAGAALLVLLALGWRPMERFLETRVVQWLGRISFSLYLVHVPIIVSSSTWLHGLPWWAGPALGIPLAFVVAVLFQRFVEGPAHRLSQRVGRGIQRRFPDGSAPAPAPSER
jgi:peptidoglycan/LPS O-acetylase OafA/YrhL